MQKGKKKNSQKCEKEQESAKCEKVRNAMQKLNQNSHRIALL
jgi:hypothetical protein